MYNPTFNVLQNTMATLPCPHKKGDVTWSRLIKGDLVILDTITNGEEKTSDKRYGSLADNSLVIRNVTSFDTATYWCNETQIFLNVITLPNVDPSAGNVPVTQRNNGLGFTENQQPSGFRKLTVGVVVGVVVGAVLVLLVTLTLRFCFNNRTERSTRNNLDKTVTDEPINEEMKVYKKQPRWRDSYF
ncbi:uncharacterized protein LOC120563692 isoform X2 [Perca fluviatilis]|uniref:uncharacterized protein LOC120563692 isoform X2 n=1 Tax=Perca fluviatilis TaxID=8168 RepID=UPI001964749D|nr:uncharacterized protein LOC120563692 isoform X2 [Perca fluviatilis]